MYIMISNIFFEELLERDSSYDSPKKHPEIIVIEMFKVNDRPAAQLVGENF